MCPESKQLIKDMNAYISKRLVLAGAIALLAHITSAQSWQAVDDFQYAPGSVYNQARAATVDALGRLYVAGEGYDAAGFMHALVMASSDYGSSWVTLEDFTYTTNWVTMFNTIGFDSAQNLYAAGLSEAKGLQANVHLIVRKSPDYGASWATVLDLPLSAYYAQPESPGFAVDAAGRIYVAAAKGPSQESFVVTSSDGGATWTISYPFANGEEMEAIVSTGAGVFVCGSRWYNWGIVRKSTDGGATWTTVDSYNPPGAVSSYYNQVSTLCADAQGNLYSGGWATITSGSGRNATTTFRWIIRQGSNQGTRWQTMASFIPPYAPVAGYGLMNMLRADSTGNLFMAGHANNDWVVVKSANQGTSWSLVDDVPNASALWLQQDLLGDLYAGGFTFAGPEQWIVRKAAAQ